MGTELRKEDYVFLTQQIVTRWFTAIHKNVFGNGPQNVHTVILDKYYVICAGLVLNRLERSLCLLPEGAEHVFLTRMLLFEDHKEQLCLSFSQDLKIPARDIRCSLDVKADKLLFVIEVDF